ncbi:SpoIIE family protein phosphatase [Planosporangium sp. 12N6]|uniref:SpoIIE family protein phosphatase n=1 Tax=Planosporangium spinosum TaxID=3402278 RepID=UPI003CECB70C
MTAAPATVLVVDDSRTKRYIIGSWLRRADLTVVEAETGAAALELLDRVEVDAVVLDVQLPDMSGFDVCERIKTHPRHGSLPVVQVSATAVNVLDRTQGLNRGADAYLAEPIEPDELLATVQAVLRYYRARQRAERLATRLAALAEATLEVNRAASYEDLLRAAATGASRMFAAPALASAGRPDGVRLMAVDPGDGSPASAAAWAGPPPSGLANTRVGAAVHTEPADRWTALLPTVPGQGVSIAAVRVRESRAPGFVTVGVDHLDDDDAHVLRQLGQAMALAVEAMRIHDEERYVALTVQRSLLPRQLPEVPGFDLSVRYVPAGSQAEIGGDFYELTTIDGQLVVAIGDVVGHSLHAATVMAELRHALRAYVVEGHGPAAVLRELNRLMVRLLPDEIATVSVLMVDPATGRVRAASGGHLPPLLIFDGKAQPVEVTGPLLGVEVDRPDEVIFDLPPGAVLVLLTDGLVERYDRSFDAGLGIVLDAAADVEDDLEAFADRLLATLDVDTSEDDVALVVLRRSVPDLSRDHGGDAGS